MKSNLFFHFVLTALVSGLGPADPPAPAESIRLPDLVAPAPPTPGPDAVQVIGADELFVVDSDIELFLRQSPAGVLTVTADAGPLRIRGKFVGGGGKIESKVFKGKFLYLIEAAQSGKADLFVIPKGVQADTSIIRRAVEAKLAPIPPPPVPPFPPGPGPQPDPTPKGKAAAFMVVEETGAADAARGRLLNDAALAKFVRDNKLTVRVVDQNTVDKDGNPPKDAAPYLQRVKDKAMKLPVLFVVDAAGGVIYADTTAMDPAAILKILGG